MVLPSSSYNGWWGAMTRWYERPHDRWAPLLVMIVLAAGCQTADPQADGDAAPSAVAVSPAELSTPEPSEGAPSPTATPAPTVDPAAAEVLAAYQAYWDTYVAANQNPPTADYPDLARYATGEALRSVAESTSQFRAAGQVFRSPPNSIVAHQTSVLEIQGDTARVRDCYSDDAWIEVVATGERSNEGVGTQLIIADLVRQDGAWKVANPVIHGQWEGVTACEQG